MLASQRQNEIYALLQQSGAVTISGLMETFGISMETARRDLMAMEKDGLLTRVHGGALPVSTPFFYRPLKERMGDRLHQKQAIAEAAAKLVNEGDYISISAGSTALCFAQELRKRIRRLTVVTYSLDVFEALRDMPDYTVMLAGSHYLAAEHAYIGPHAAAFLSGMYVQKAFTCPSALSLEEGITCRMAELIPQQLAMLHSCDQVFVLADSSKFQQNAPHRITLLRKDFTIITDAGLPDGYRELYQTNQLNLIITK